MVTYYTLYEMEIPYVEYTILYLFYSLQCRVQLLPSGLYVARLEVIVLSVRTSSSQVAKQCNGEMYLNC